MEVWMLCCISGMVAAVIVAMYSQSVIAGHGGLQDGTVGSDIPIRSSNFRADHYTTGPNGYIQHDR
jgi:hypothetical protein